MTKEQMYLLGFNTALNRFEEKLLLQCDKNNSFGFSVNIAEIKCIKKELERIVNNG